MFTAVCLFAVVGIGCSGTKASPDAYGNFEAIETTVSSEATGTLVAFRAREGRRMARGEVAAIVDTTQLVLQRRAIEAQRASARSRIAGVRAQLDVLGERLDIARREAARFENLVRQDAAPQKQLDDVRDQVRVLEREMTSVRTQIGAIENEIEALDARAAQVADQIARSVVVNPIDGTVLSTFAEQHELAAAGRPLYVIASLDTLTLKAYVSGAQLASVSLGERVDVVVDGTSGTLETLPGTVSRIASEAEFTPRYIQTREERVDLVYAVDIRVPNPDGLLKIGMPGELMIRD